MSDTGLQHLHARLSRLEDAPVEAHPDVLDEVHRAIVAALESLAESRVDGTSSSHRP